MDFSRGRRGQGALQDISYEPFRDMKFLVGESRRLLAWPALAR